MRPSPENPGYLNIGCGPFRAPEPWHNIDVVATEHPEYPTRPDEVVPRDRSVVELFGVRSCRAIYMGHLLEHVPWERVTEFLSERVAPALVDDGKLGIVCPDVYRAIQMWHRGESTWEWVVAAIEDDVSQFDLQESRLEDHELVTYLCGENATNGWPEARHKWNAYEDRLLRVVRHALPDWDVRAVPIEERYLHEFPVVAYTAYQCAVVAQRVDGSV